MNLWNRAFLYIRRKWSKSLLLFFIMLIIVMLALIGISIQRAAGTAELMLRKSLGGSFSFSIKEQNMKSANKTSGLLDQKTIERVMNHSGISAYNAVQYGNAILKKSNSQDMQLIVTAELPKNEEYLNHMIKSKAQTNPQYDLNFLTGALKLSEGRKIRSSDSNVAVISRALAAINGLHIGDEIELAMNRELAKDYPNHANDTVKLKIVGFFDVVQKTQNAGAQVPFNLPENLVLMDPGASLNFYRFQDESYDKVDFYATDPAQIDSIVDSIKNDSEIDNKDFYIDKNYSYYKDASKPLESMQMLMNVMLLILLASGVAILCLILTMHMKSRVHETGVMLSLGIEKGKILMQHIVEFMLIAAVAFTLAAFGSRFAAQKVCDIMLNVSNVKNVSQTIASSLQGAQYQVSRIEAKVDPQDMAVVFGAGAVAVLFSVGISSLSVLTLKPKDILTRME